MEVSPLALFDFARPASRPAASTVNQMVLTAGDHLKVDRGLYWHHAIYVEGGWLIEFGSGAFGGPVRCVWWDDFARTATPKLVARGGLQALERAKSQLGRDDFNLLLRNCEHFANWCVSGRWESGQVQFALGALAVATLIWLGTRKAA